MNLAKAYTPNDYEPNIYAMWETSGAFAPTGKGEPYGVIMPPPNANGNLHIGHALDMNLKDILARFHRMKGYDVAFIPGADHAGFETWVVYERLLQKEGKSRFDFSRDELYGRVWDFVDERRGDMELQLRALGTSASWEHLVFTLDKKVIQTTYDTFKKMWDDGLIYRGERIVNYCTEYQTSFADIEIEHKVQKGKLWHIAYPMLESVGEIVVATTRPETMLGDVAIAVHPEDERYAHLVGSHVQLPIMKRKIPIIADEYVDREFGTGVVKITPAHDPNDFEIGKRHNLETLSVIGTDGKMTEAAGAFAGLTTLEARKRIVASLKAQEYLRKEEDYEHSVGHCYKSGTPIQPLVMDQWFIKVKPLADAAIKALKAGEIKTVPKQKVRELCAYLEQLHDWNISRQIAWGIPIPAFVNIEDNTDWIFDERVDQERITVDGKTYRREEDTFDTWFSSGQWPYIITDKIGEGELSRFYPLSILETGADIMRQWVARMIMLGIYRTGEVPFKDIYLHGMVNDENNQKMSKSKGNVVNPIELVTKYGSDATRMGIIANRSAAQPQAFSVPTVVAGRNFCNKLWNIARFVEQLVGDEPVSPKFEPKSIADHWVVSRINGAIADVEYYLSEYRFSEAADVVYHTIWDDVADWYIEVAKTEKNLSTLVWVLDRCLRIAHPFAPFVTETIWQTLRWQDDMLITADWPKQLENNAIAAGEFDRLKDLIVEIRFVMNDMPGTKKYGLLYGSDSLIEDNAELVAKLSKVTEVNPVETPRGLRLAGSGREAWLDVDKETLYEYQSDLEVRLAKAKQEAKGLKARLDNENYIKKAPAELVEDTKRQLEAKMKQIEQYARELAVIGD